MGPIIDMEIEIPDSLASKQADIDMGRPGTPFSESLDRPSDYGFGNYNKIFGFDPANIDKQVDDGGMEKLITDMDNAAVDFGLLVGMANNDIGKIHQAYPNRFKMFATLNPMDGMRAVRELERLVREDGVNGFRVSALYNGLPANDRRYYPLYAKCVELGIPVRIYASMNYANDRPYDLGHPRYIDDIAIDFPELKIVAGLAGWPWIDDMVGLLRRHPNLYCDTGAHRPRYFGKDGSGWEMFMQYGNTLLQDKVMIGFSKNLFNCTYEELIDEYKLLPIKEAVLEKWLYHNANNFFGNEC